MTVWKRLTTQHHYLGELVLDWIHENASAVATVSFFGDECAAGAILCLARLGFATLRSMEASTDACGGELGAINNSACWAAQQMLQWGRAGFPLCL